MLLLSKIQVIIAWDYWFQEKQFCKVRSIKCLKWLSHMEKLKTLSNITLQVDRRIRGFGYPRLATAQKKIWKIKEINGS